jgi:hypothetical protein
MNAKVIEVGHYFYRQNQMLLKYFDDYWLIMNHHYDDQYLFDPKQIHNLQALHQVLIEIFLKEILNQIFVFLVIIPCA